MDGKSSWQWQDSTKKSNFLLQAQSAEKCAAQLKLARAAAADGATAS